jgi:hypothetical protein
VKGGEVTEEEKKLAEVATLEKEKLKQIRKNQKEALKELRNAQKLQFEAEKAQSAKDRLKFIEQQTEIFTHFMSPKKQTAGR